MIKMRVNGAVALSRLSVILSSSLAQDSHLVFWERFELDPKIENSSASLNRLIFYENSLWTKKQPATFGSVVGRLQPLDVQ